MAATHGTGTVVIRRSHHIACLAVYLLRATERGLVAIVQSSDPSVAAVVPHGGLTPIVTPNPIAAGLPTSGDPILIDISSSITSMGFARQQMKAGKKLPGAWVIDHEGNATDDPGALFAEPKGALLPLGGLDAGYKGFGLALLIEALTAGLSGHGRADPPRRLGRHGVRAGARPRGVRRDSRRSSGRWTTWSTPRTRRSPAPASRACGCRARRAWRACASSAHKASRSIPRSCRRSCPGRKSSACAVPR